MYTLACKDMIENGCSFIAEGDTQEEVLQTAAEHGMQDHDMTEADMTDEMKDKAMSMMQEQEA